MKFLYPELFWLLLLVVPFFAKKHLSGFRSRFYGYLLTSIFLIIALARPVVEQEPIKSKQMLSDVILAVDLSYSMQANDIEPTRLAYAKESLQKMLNSQSSSRFGVLGFTTNAIILSPLTEDRELLLHLFSLLDDKLIITKGSSVMSALVLARKMSSSKALSVVLFSDGADELNYDSETRFAKENGLVVNVFMVATKSGGTMKLENGELLRDELGEIVVTRENDAIEALSSGTGGVYTKDLGELQQALKSQKSALFQSESLIVRNLELFYVFIVLAVISFMLSITTLRRFLIIALAFIGIAASADENADYFKQATAYYRGGEYEKALQNYEMVKSQDAKVKSIVYYNIGNSLVRLKEYKKATEAYQKSLTLSYSLQADENMRHIQNAPEKKEMLTGRQKSKNQSATAKQEDSSAKKKEGGGSNMDVSANAGSGADDGGKKSEMQNAINLNSGKAKLSSQQYELINKGGINEKKPW